MPEEVKPAQISAPAQPKRVIGRPFARGNVANPGGRPKSVKEIEALARQFSPEAIERLAHWMRSDEPRASVAATNALLDRAYGKAKQAIVAEDGAGVLLGVVLLPSKGGN